MILLLRRKETARHRRLPLCSRLTGVAFGYFVPDQLGAAGGQGSEEKNDKISNGFITRCVI